MITEQQPSDKGKELVQAAEKLNAFVEQAAREGMPLHEFEEELRQCVFEMARLGMQTFLDRQGDGDQGPTVTAPDGQTLKRLEEPHSRPYQSIFGEFEIQRRVYGTREGQKIAYVLLDERLALPESKFSYLLQNWSQMLATDEAFAKVSAFLERVFGVRLPVDSLERTGRRMAEDVEAFRESRPVPPAEEEGAFVVQSADGKGVPIRRTADTARIQEHKSKRGPKQDRKRMAVVGAVYSVDRYVRTPEEIVEALFRQPGEESPEDSRRRPRPAHKRVWARLLHDEGADGESRNGLAEVMGWMSVETENRNPGWRKETVCLMDGQESLWEARQAFQGEKPVVEILDLLHVTSRLWQAAHLFHAPESREADAFVRDRLLRILRGEAALVVRGLRQMATKRRLRGRKRQTLETICGYFTNNLARMRYDEYLARGYPIASGAIEGACRHLVKDRMERAGMRWVKAGARAMLDLRSTRLNGDWEEFMRFRIRRETERLYPNRRHNQPDLRPLTV